MRKLLLEKKAVPVPAFLCLGTGALLLVTTGNVSALLWTYAAGLFHGTQYLAVSLAYYLKERGLPNNMPTSQISSLILQSSALKYLGLVTLIGGFVFLAIPEVCQQFGFDYTLASGAILAAVNCHHFITDSAIWRLRDPQSRKILLA